MGSVKDLAEYLLAKIQTIKHQALLLDYIKGPNEVQQILQLQDDLFQLQKQMNELEIINKKQKERIKELTTKNDHVVKLNNIIVEQLLKRQSNVDPVPANSSIPEQKVTNCGITKPVVRSTPQSIDIPDYKLKRIPLKGGFMTPSDCSTDEEDPIIPSFEVVRKNSPYFSFFELEPISQKEFCQIPKYMRDEKTTIEKLNWAIGELNKAREKKYSILSTEKANLNDRIRTAIREYKEQDIKATNNYPFIVEKDLKEFTNFKLDKSGLKFMTIFRHCKRVKEVRGNNLIRYVFI